MEFGFVQEIFQIDILNELDFACQKKTRHVLKYPGDHRCM